jgi:hypothetical protein
MVVANKEQTRFVLEPSRGMTDYITDGEIRMDAKKRRTLMSYGAVCGGAFGGAVGVGMGNFPLGIIAGLAVGLLVTFYLLGRADASNKK